MASTIPIGIHQLLLYSNQDHDSYGLTITGKLDRAFLETKCQQTYCFLCYGGQVGSVVSYPAFHFCGPRFESHHRPEPCMLLPF